MKVVSIILNIRISSFASLPPVHGVGVDEIGRGESGQPLSREKKVSVLKPPKVKEGIRSLTAPKNPIAAAKPNVYDLNL